MKAIIPVLLVAFFFNLAHADIRPEHSGAWYNPDQAGHGLSVQVLDDERTIAFWFTYTPDGSPMFLFIRIVRPSLALIIYGSAGLFLLLIIR